MRNLISAMTLVVSGFMAGVHYSQVSPIPIVHTDPDLPVIQERVADFELQIDNLEQAIRHACSIPGVPDVSRPEEAIPPPD